MDDWSRLPTGNAASEPETDPNTHLEALLDTDRPFMDDNRPSI